MSNLSIVPYIPAPTKYKRTDAERERDMVVIARLYLRSYSQTEIAEYLSKRRSYTMTQQGISKEITEIQKLWLTSALQDFDALKAKELARLDDLEREYWAGWKKSQGDQTKTSETNINDFNLGSDGTPASGYSRSKKDTEKIKRDGNVAYLKGVERCIELRCRVLGLFEPEKFAIVDWRSDAKKIGLENEAINQFEKMVEDATQALLASKALDNNDEQLPSGNDG